MLIYTPAGTIAPPSTERAMSPKALKGKRIGVLDNRKPNAGLLMAQLAKRIGERTGAELVLVESKNAAIAAPDEVMGKLIAEVDLVLTGSAD